MSAARIGILTQEPAPLLLHQCGLLGVGLVLLDAEQTALTAADCAVAADILRAYSTRLAVRVPDLATTTLVTFANTGVDELVLPQVNELDEVKRAWHAVHYAPDGDRAHQVTAASRFGTDFGHVPLLSMIIETVTAATNPEPFARTPLLSSVSVGMNDLRDDVVRSGGDPDDLAALVDSVIGVMNDAGRPVGLAASDADGVTAAFARGATHCIVYWERFVASALRALGAAATT